MFSIIHQPMKTTHHRCAVIHRQTMTNPRWTRNLIQTRKPRETVGMEWLPKTLARHPATTLFSTNFPLEYLSPEGSNSGLISRPLLLLLFSCLDTGSKTTTHRTFHSKAAIKKSQIASTSRITHWAMATVRIMTQLHKPILIVPRTYWKSRPTGGKKKWTHGFRVC